MTLTKNSTNYSVVDTIDEVNVNGSVQVNEEGTVSISINTDNGGYASYSKDANGFVNFSSSFNQANDLIDYMQGLIEAVFTELGGGQE